MRNLATIPTIKPKKIHPMMCITSSFAARGRRLSTKDLYPLSPEPVPGAARHRPPFLYK
jgi:hypothetical protein